MRISSLRSDTLSSTWASACASSYSMRALAARSSLSWSLSCTSSAMLALASTWSCSTASASFFRAGSDASTPSMERYTAASSIAHLRVVLACDCETLSIDSCTMAKVSSGTPRSARSRFSRRSESSAGYGSEGLTFAPAVSPSASSPATTTASNYSLSTVASYAADVSFESPPSIS